MKLNEEYCRDSEKDKKDEKGQPVNKGKKVISDDSYAVCDFIQKLIFKLEQFRVSNLMTR